MNKEIKELFDKYGVKDLKDKNGQSECHYCKNIKHKYSLTWTSFLYEYKEDYYCFDCLLTILLQQENKELHNKIDKAIEYIEHFSKDSEIRIYGIPATKVFIGDMEQLLEILKDSDVNV